MDSGDTTVWIDNGFMERIQRLPSQQDIFINLPNFNPEAYFCRQENPFYAQDCVRYGSDAAFNLQLLQFGPFGQRNIVPEAADAAQKAITEQLQRDGRLFLYECSVIGDANSVEAPILMVAQERHLEGADMCVTGNSYLISSAGLVVRLPTLSELQDLRMAQLTSSLHKAYLISVNAGLERDRQLLQQILDKNQKNN